MTLAWSPDELRAAWTRAEIDKLIAEGWTPSAAAAHVENLCDIAVCPECGRA